MKKQKVNRRRCAQCASLMRTAVLRLDVGVWTGRRPGSFRLCSADCLVLFAARRGWWK